MRVYTWGNNDPRRGGPSRPRQSGRDAESGSDDDSRQNRDEIIDLEYEELKRDADGEKSP